MNEKNNYVDDLVSIITPVYNAEMFVEETIKSVQAQTYKNWEMILVDDLSTDNSEKIIKRIKEQDERITYIKLKENSGAAAARNTALENAKGRYVAFLDSDDLWKSNKLEKQISFMKNNNVSFSYTSYEIIDENSKKINKVKRASEKIDYNTLLKKNIIGCLSVVIDRKNIINPKFSKVRHEDYALWLDILKDIDYAYGLDEILGKYRVRANSLSSNKIKSAIWTWNIYRKKEKLNLIKSIVCFCNYTINSII